MGPAGNGGVTLPDDPQVDDRVDGADLKLKAALTIPVRIDVDLERLALPERAVAKT